MFGQRLRHVRRARGLTLAELGERQPPGAADMPEPLTEHPEIPALISEGVRIFLREDCHIFILNELLLKFRTKCPSPRVTA